MEISAQTGAARPTVAGDATATERDRALVERMLAGDAEAFGTLVDALHAPMTRLARALVGNTSHVPDVVQDTWVSVVSNLPRFEGRSSLKTWVLTILSNRARTVATRAGRCEAVASFDVDPNDGEPTVPASRFTAIGAWRTPPSAWDERTPEGQLLQKELVALVARELETLPAAQRAVVALRDVEGLSSEEACAVLELSEVNQRVLLHRGRAKLRAAIERALNDGDQKGRGAP